MRQEEEEAAVASILVNSIDEAEKIDSADVMAPGIMETEGREGETKREIKFQLPNNASYLVDRECGQKVDNIISILLKRRSQKLSSFDAFSSDNEPIDLSKDCSTLSCNEVLVQPAAADQTQELVNDDECPEPPPRTSTPVPGHDVDISCPSLNTTEILVREHSYSRIWSESFSEPQSMRSVSGYHSLSVSEVEGAAADQGQTTTTSLGLSGYTASCVTNQSLSPQMDRANQMPVSFSDGEIHEAIIPGPVTSQSFLYLSYHGTNEDGDLLVSLETLVILFSIKFCDIKNIKIRLLNDSCRTESDSVVKISIKKDISLDYKIVETSDVASELQACRLPAWYLPNQRTCIAGLHYTYHSTLLFYEL